MIHSPLSDRLISLGVDSALSGVVVEGGVGGEGGGGGKGRGGGGE